MGLSFVSGVFSNHTVQVCRYDLGRVRPGENFNRLLFDDASDELSELKLFLNLPAGLPIDIIKHITASFRSDISPIHQLSELFGSV